MAGGDRRRRGARSIALSIFALTLGAVLVVAAALFVVTFAGPPPRTAPVRVADLVKALRTGIAERRDSEPMTVVTRPMPPEQRRRERRDPELEQRIAATLGRPAGDVVAWRTGRDGPIFGTRPPIPDMLRHHGPLADGIVFGRFSVGVRTGAGWRIARTRPEPLLTAWHIATLGAMLLALLILAVPSWLIARAISRPLRQLAAAAERASGLLPLGALPAGGPREVRDLTASLAAMHARVGRQTARRTAMLGAIAHDLGTPLTRLAYRIQALPEAARGAAQADLDEMRAMIAATLAFARDEAAPRQLARVDLASLLDSVAEDARVAGHDATVVSDGRVLVMGDAMALRRLFTNLVENAARYGYRARLGWRVEPGVVEVEVSDDGPGFDPAGAEELFEPFVRGDPSRNRGTGGTGLGLAIVRAIADAHSGRVTLGRRPDGGGLVRVRLPRAG